MKIALNILLTTIILLSSFESRASQLFESIDNFFDRKTCFLLVATGFGIWITQKNSTAPKVNDTVNDSDIATLRAQVNAQGKRIEELESEQKQTRAQCADLVKRFNAISDIMYGKALQTHTHLYATALVGAINGINDALNTKENGLLASMKTKYNGDPRAMGLLTTFEKSLNTAVKQSNEAFVALVELSKYQTPD